MGERNYVFNRKKIPKNNSFLSKFERLFETSADYRGYYAQCQNHLRDTVPAKYLQRFGLPLDFLAHYEVGYDPERELIIVPHSQAFFTSVYIGDPNKPCPTFQFKGTYEFFNYQALNYGVFAVTENIFDALMLEYSGLQTIALGSSVNKEHFVDIVVKEYTRDQMLLLAFRKDERSKKLSDWLEESLRKKGIFAENISKDVVGLFDPKKYQSQKERWQYIEEFFGDFGTFSMLLSLKNEFDEEWCLAEFNKKCRREFFETDKTDSDNAARILYVYGNHIRYVRDYDRWLTYDDKKGVWNLGLSKNSEIFPFARKLAKHMIKLSKDEVERKQAIALYSRKKCSDAIEMIKSFEEYLVESKGLNDNPMLLNCANGVIDLETGNLMSHDSKFLFTQIAGAEYIKGYRSAIFDEFLSQILPDEETREALLLFLGYCLTGSVREEKALFINGPGGNGKGTLTKVLKTALGSFATPFRIEAVLAGTYNKDGEAPSPEIAKLLWQRVAIAEEIPAGRRMDSAKFKLLTAGDPLPIRKLHCDPTVIENPTHKMIFSGNYLPELDDTGDIGLRRRLLNMPFKQDFTGAKCNPKLKEELLKPEALAGCLSLLVDYCLKYQKEGLRVSREMEKALEEYLAENDIVSRFVEDNCVFDINGSISRKEFLDRIREKGTGTMTENAITKAVISIAGVGYRRSGPNGNWEFNGIRWK